jgi:hypothetical protein
MSDEARSLKTLWVTPGKHGRFDDSLLRESANGEDEKVEKESLFSREDFLGGPAQPSTSRNLDGDFLSGETKNSDQSAGFIFVEKVEKKRPVRNGEFSGEPDQSLVNGKLDGNFSFVETQSVAEVIVCANTMGYHWICQSSSSRS